MVIDDDPFVRIIMSDALLGTGGVVKTFASGDEALAATTAFQPDLILLDLRMQGMDGRATAQALRKENAQTRIIFLTAEDDAHARDEIMGLGAVGIITKPFDPAHVVNLIQPMLGRAPSGARTAQFDAIALDFRDSLAPTMDSIQGAWAKVRAGGWQKDSAEVILAKAHMLAGSAGLFHLHSIGNAADRLEGTLRELLKADLLPPPAALTRIEAEIGGLIDACRVGALG